MTLEGRIDEIESLDRDEIEAMYELMTRHYANVQRSVFDADLLEKRWTIRLVDEGSGQLLGFSTQMLLAARVAGRPIRALFSGDTIVDRQHWGTTALALAWGRLAFSIIQQHSGEDLYWFLISQGYRTYRFLPVYFREFYPRCDVTTPDWAREVIDALATAKFPKTYDRRAGVVRASSASYQLRAGLADLTGDRLKDSEVRYFLECNPGYERGDELCCLAPLTHENFSRVAQRLIRSDRFARSVTP